MKYYVVLFLTLIGCIPLSSNAQTSQSQPQRWSFYPNIGYTIGGVLPQPFPKEIREIEDINFMRGLSFGLEARYAYRERLGFSVGLNIAYRGMITQAYVKSYHTLLQRGNEKLEGYFTGKNETELLTTTLNIPLRCTWQCTPRLLLSAGPYIDVNLQKHFAGSVYNGYIRIATPTGEKVEFDAQKSSSTPTFEFTEHMRPVTWGLSCLVDYKVYRQWSVYASMDYGLNDLFKADFSTISFPLHTLYARVGLAYRIQ